MFILLGCYSISLKIIIIHRTGEIAKMAWNYVNNGGQEHEKIKIQDWKLGIEWITTTIWIPSSRRGCVLISRRAMGFLLFISTTEHMNSWINLIQTISCNPRKKKKNKPYRNMLSTQQKRTKVLFIESKTQKLSGVETRYIFQINNTCWNTWFHQIISIYAHWGTPKMLSKFNSWLNCWCTCFSMLKPHNLINLKTKEKGKERKETRKNSIKWSSLIGQPSIKMNIP